MPVVRLTGRAEWRSQDEAPQRSDSLDARLRDGRSLGLDISYSVSRFTGTLDSHDGRRFGGLLHDVKGSAGNAEVSGDLASVEDGWRLVGRWTERSTDYELVIDLDPVDEP